MITSHAPGLGFSLNPVKAVKTVVKKTVIAPTKLVAKGVYQAHAIPTKLALKVTKAATSFMLKPITNRLNDMKNRRAKKLAMERRKSTTPTEAERAEARSWVKSQLSAKGVHGKALALLAGAPPQVSDDGVLLGHMGYQLGVAPVVLAAAIPAMTAVLMQIIKGMQSKGELDAKGNVNASVNVQAQVPQEYVQAAQVAQQAYEAGQQVYEAAQSMPEPEVNVDAQVSFDVNAGGQVSPYAEQSMQGAIFGAFEPPTAASWAVLAGLGLAAGFGFWRAVR